MTNLPDKLPRCRYQTYRTPDAARRSYYKFVCKQGLYGRLRYDHWIGYYRDYTGCHYGRTYTHGYPRWDGPRNTAKANWENQFDEHLERWHSAINAMVFEMDETDRLLSEARKEISKYNENHEGTARNVVRRTGQFPRKKNNGQRTKRNIKRSRKIPALNKAGTGVRKNAGASAKTNRPRLSITNTKVQSLHV